MTQQLRERVHERTWELLPWYANGSLAPNEREAVEAHLGECPRCQLELTECRSLDAALRASEQAVPSPHPVQLARLMARIDALEGSEAPAAGGDLLGAAGHGVRGFWAAAGSSPLRWAVAAQLALLLALGALVASHPLWRPDAVYQVLSEQAPRAGIRVLFAEEASQRQIRDLLERIHARIVDGPSPVGAYIIQIAPGGSRQDPLEVVLTYLQSQPLVRFAQPVAGAVDTKRAVEANRSR
jgi:hypothetical protein